MYDVQSTLKTEKLTQSTLYILHSTSYKEKK